MNSSTAHAPIEHRKRPRFVWDYDLDEAEVRSILSEPGCSPKKRWLMERILSQSRFDEVFQYLDLATIRRHMDDLSLPEPLRGYWQYALNLWGRDE